MGNVGWDGVAAIAAISGLLGGVIAWIVGEVRAHKAKRLALQRSAQEELDRQKNELRRNEVHAWADRSMDMLVSLSMWTRYPEALETETLQAKLFELARVSSLLVEQGRLFFKNKPQGDYGKEKHAAYRGLRPKILDELVLAHQIALAWQMSDAGTRRKLAYLAHGALQKFVSLAQLEVAREQSASAYAAAGGQGVSLNWLLSDSDLDQVEAWERDHVVPSAQAAGL